MTPTEFGVRVAATDERFKRARELDDIPEMRAALAKNCTTHELLRRAGKRKRNRLPA